MTELIRIDDHRDINRKFGMRELNDLLEKATARETEFRTKDSFAPSGLGYQGSCPRYWWYARHGAEFSYDTRPAAVSNMNAGSDSGVRLAKLFEKGGILVDSEIPVRHDDPPIFGYIDAIVNWQDQEVVVEIKTTSNRQWNWRVLNNMVPGYQLIQLLIYMYITDHERAFFMTENKDTHELFVLPVKMTDEHKALVEQTFEWLREVEQNAATGELPIRPFTKGSPQCKGCPVRKTCWEDEPGVVDLGVLTLPK